MKLNVALIARMAFYALLIIAIGTADFLTGTEIILWLLYLVPIAGMTWRAGLVAGLVAALASTLVTWRADLLAGLAYSSAAVYFWNYTIEFVMYCAVAALVATLHDALRHERSLARIDPLTQAANRRAFHERLTEEMERSRRYAHPLTLVYIDVDDLKKVNDRHGHAHADRLLQRMARDVREELRAVDLFGRLGGDEFAILLPETDGTAAKEAVSRIAERLRRDAELHDTLTVSMGAVTTARMPDSYLTLLRQADALMYEAKNAGKNSVRYAEVTTL